MSQEHFDRIRALSVPLAGVLANVVARDGAERAITHLQGALNDVNPDPRLFTDVRVDGSICAETLHALAVFLTYRGKAGELVLISVLKERARQDR